MPYFGSLVLSLSLAVIAYAQPNFQTIRCTKAASDSMLIKSDEGKLAFEWTTSGGPEVLKLLRAITPEAIPVSLLDAYRDVRISFSLPAESCKFESKKGRFSCESHAEGGTVLPFIVYARTTAHDHNLKPDQYRGTFASAEVSTLFSGKKGQRILEFPIRLVVRSPKTAVMDEKTSFYFAHYWEADGIDQMPSCKVDADYLVD